MISTLGLKCPACTKTARRRQDIYLHFFQALSGWGQLWDRTNPHVTWAEEQGIVVLEGSFSNDLDNLKRVIYQWLDDVGKSHCR